MEFLNYGKQTKLTGLTHPRSKLRLKTGMNLSLFHEWNFALTLALWRILLFIPLKHQILA